MERKTVILKAGGWRQETVSGITSLCARRADATQLLSLTHGHWSIENRPHWARDVTFGEDASLVR